MRGRVVLALTDAQAAALVAFTSNGGNTPIVPQNVPGDVRARGRTFAALAARGWIAEAVTMNPGHWYLTPSGREVAAVARRLANAGDLSAFYAPRQPCAA